jgi:hypothetical protein
MKKAILITLTVFSFSFQINAQHQSQRFLCHTPPQQSVWLAEFQQDVEAYEKTGDTLYIPITIHLVGTDEGEAHFPLQQVLDELCELNQAYAGAEIYFFLGNGVNYINNTDWFKGNDPVGMMNTNNVNNTVNCYIIGASNSDFLGFYSSSGDAVSMNRQGLKNWDPLFPHELGHYFSLYHTFLGWENMAWDFSTPAPEYVGGYKVERVDLLDCEIAGDGFCDTPPDYLSGTVYPCNFNEESILTQTDPTGTAFQSDCSLIMSYSSLGYRFSDMQISAMRANIEELRPYLLYDENPLPALIDPDVVLLSPAQGVMVSPNDPLTLEWEAVPNATHYLVDVTFLPYFSVVYDQYIVEGNTFVLESLLSGKNYRWRVKPYNAFHTCANYSEEGRFSTGTPTACDRSEIIGTTVYDLQTNASGCNRISRDAENNIMATWTMGFDHETGYPDRGTGYNRFDAASGTWETIPTQRLEQNARTGWPNHIITDSGTELIINHVFTSQGVFLHTLRRAVGSNWVESEVPTSTPRGVITARMTSSGDTIHLIAPSTPQNFGGVNYLGVNGHLLYYRSPDGGISWDIVDGIIPGLDNSFMAELGSIDSYAIDAREGVIVVAVFSQTNDVRVFKSVNGGSNWTHTRIYDFPIDMYQIDQGYTLNDLPPPTPQQPDPFAILTTDNSGSVLIDHNGIAHAFYGQMYIKDNLSMFGSIDKIFHGTSGLVYWNESFGADSTRIIADITDLNGDDIIDIETDINVAQYRLSMTSQPSPAVDQNNTIFLAYSSVMEGAEYRQNDEAEQFRHIMIIHSEDSGETWSAPYDAINETTLCDSHLPYFMETVYPSMVRDIDDEVQFIYQYDFRPGISLLGDTPDINYMGFTYIPLSEFGVVDTKNIVSPENFQMTLQPNPASNLVKLEFKLDHRTLTKQTLFDMFGRPVQQIKSSTLPAGIHHLSFDVSNLPAGLYLVQLQAGHNIAVKKLVVN